MNILIDTLPTTVNTSEGVFEPETDYRAGIAFELAVQGAKDLTPEIVEQLMDIFYPDGIPENVTGAWEAMIWFYRCGNDQTEPDDKPKSNKRAYAFDVDAETIYADFWRYYNIDLSKERLHWWKFRALLLGLPEDSAFKERIYYRTCDLKGLPKKEKERICKIRKQIEIRDEIGVKTTLEERNNKMIAYVKKRSTEAKREVKS